LFHLPIQENLAPSNNRLDFWYLGGFFILCAFLGFKKYDYIRKRLLIIPVFAVYLVLIYHPPFNYYTSQLPFVGKLIVPLRFLPVLNIFFLLAATFSIDKWIKYKNDEDNIFSGKFAAVICICYAVSVPFFNMGTYRFMIARLVFCLVLLVFGLYIFSGKSGCWDERKKSIIAVLIIILDIYLLSVLCVTMTDMKKFNKVETGINFLKNTSSKFRYSIISSIGVMTSADAGLPYHIGLKLNADTIDSYSRVPQWTSAKRLEKLYPSLFRYEGNKLRQYDQMVFRAPDNISHENLSLFNEMNVKYIISRYKWSPKNDSVNITLVNERPYLYVYQNNTVLPRAKQEMEKNTYPLKVIYPSADSVNIFGFSSSGLKENGPKKTTLRDSYYPGWKAFSNGVEVPVRINDIGFRTLPVPGLANNISMVFCPSSFRVGLWAGLTSIFIMALVFLKYFIYKPA
jgi:hypothetical protein